MPKELLKKYTPNPETLQNHKALRVVAHWLQDPNLWHFNRRSVSWAVFIGLFWCYLPVPGQMWGASVTAIIFRKNLPISFALIWITNPLTIPPMFYFAYLVGTWVLGLESTIGGAEGLQGIIDSFELSWAWIKNLFESIGTPLLVGSLICAVSLGTLGYASIRLYWRWHVVKRYRERQAKRQAKAAL